MERCAGSIAKYKWEYKCPKCEEEGSQVKTKEGGNTGKITNKIARIKEKEILTLTVEEFLKNWTSKKNKRRRINKNTK